jgi:hypothetical protein
MLSENEVITRPPSLFLRIFSHFFTLFAIMVTTCHQALLAKAEEQEEEEQEEEEEEEAAAAAAATDHDLMVNQMEDPPGGLPEPGSAADFVSIGADIMTWSPPSIFSGGHSRAFNERWAAHFQVEPEVCENVYGLDWILLSF